MTKMDRFASLKDVVMNAEIEDGIREELIEFLDKEIASLEKKAETAKARAAKKKEESDALTEAIYALVSDQLVTVDTIVVELNDESVTRNKVISRLGKLVKENLIVKEKVKDENGSRKMAYRLASSTGVDVEEDAE